MRAIELHRDAGAYALGVLWPAYARGFDGHLARCPACAVRVWGSA
ncbi:hypothetical protein [Streptomyces sp. NPDC005752]